MLSDSLCQRAHADLVFGVCPWCQRRVTYGQTVKDYQDLKQRILAKLRDKFDVSRVRGGDDTLLRGQLHKAIQRMCMLKAVVLNRLELESLVEEILEEFLGDERRARQ